jgi:hypothetical protein
MSGPPLGHVEARSRALLTDGEEARQLYGETIEHLAAEFNSA